MDLLGWDLGDVPVVVFAPFALGLVVDVEEVVAGGGAALVHHQGEEVVLGCFALLGEGFLVLF